MNKSNPLSSKEYDAWKRSKLASIEDDYIDDRPYFLERLVYFAQKEEQIRQKFDIYLLPPFQTEELEAFEKKNHVYLPIELKYFLLKISRTIPTGQSKWRIFSLYDFDYYQDPYAEDKDESLDNYYFSRENQITYMIDDYQTEFKNIFPNKIEVKKNIYDHYLALTNINKIDKGKIYDVRDFLTREIINVNFPRYEDFTCVLCDQCYSQAQQSHITDHHYYHCDLCIDLDLCQHCYETQAQPYNHTSDHPMTRYERKPHCPEMKQCCDCGKDLIDQTDSQSYHYCFSCADYYCQSCLNEESDIEKKLCFKCDIGLRQHVYIKNDESESDESESDESELIYHDDRQMSEDDYALFKQYDRQFFPGTITLAELGCGEQDTIIVTGPFAGTVITWMYSEQSPCLNYYVTISSFFKYLDFHYYRKQRMEEETET